MTTRRRDLLIIAAVATVAVAVPPILRRLDRPFEFQPISGLQGFRRLPTGVSSGADLILTGLQEPSDLQVGLRREVAKNPCQAVFGSMGWQDGRVPLAVFTDYNCPYCPVLSDVVIDLMQDGAPIDVVWHDLPVLGPRSEAAARAALAAAAQEQYLPVHKHLMRSVLRPGPAQLSSIAREFGLDEGKFLTDLASPGTALAIDRSRAIAAVFGIAGTPAMIVGRTLVVGKIDRRGLEKLVAIEQKTRFPGCTG